MKEAHYKTIVGVFALVCLSILGILVIMFGGNQAIFSSSYNLNIRFKNGVTGVQSGQSVTLNGVRIGQTSKVEFWDPSDVRAGIRVVAAIDSDFSIPQGARVSIASSIMGFGRPAIMVEIGGLETAAPFPRDGSGTMEGRMINVLDQMLPPDMQATLVGSFEGIKTLSEALKPVAVNLETLLQQHDMEAVDAKETVANMSTLIQRFDLVLKNFNVILADAENIANLKATLANARTMSERGVTALEKFDKLSEQGAVMATDATALIRDMRGSVDKLSGVLTEFNKSAAAMNDTKGTVGLLLNDNRLYEELILSARRLSAALDELRAAMEVIKKEGFRVKM